MPLKYVLVLYFRASAASAFSTVIPRIYLRFRGCPVVLDIGLAVSAWYQKTRRALLRARRRLLLLLLLQESRGVRCAYNFQNYMEYGAKKKKRFCANQNTKESRRKQYTPTSKRIFSFMETPYMELRAGPTQKVKRRKSRLRIPQNTHAPPPRDRGCHNTCLYLPLAYVCRSVQSREHDGMALTKLGN